MAMPDVEVLICGAGAAGLTLAIDLARRGISFALVEQASAPFGGSRGKGIQPRSLEVFDDLGVVDRILASGGRYPLVREHATDGRWTDAVMMEERPPSSGETYAAPAMVAQFLTEGVLRDRLAEFGERPRFGHRLERFEQDAHGVTARIVADGTACAFRTRYLVGTDGGRSFIRRALGIGFPGRDLGQRAIVADLTLTGLDRDRWHRFGSGSAEGPVMLCPLAGTPLFQLQAAVPLDGEIDVSRDALAELVARRTGRTDIIVAAVHWASVYSMGARLADRYRAGRVLLAGDAAHIHPPTGAQGLNTSVQDAYNLGWKLASVVQGGPEWLLDSYEEERRPVAAAMLNLTTRLLGDAGGPMKRGREVQQLELAYPDTPVSMAGGAERAIRPGDRAPDASLVRRGGGATRLHDLLRGTHWTLIGYRTDGTSFTTRRGLHIHRLGWDLDDADEAVRDTCGLMPGDWMLIRPDGHVAAIAAADGAGALDAHLAQLGLPH